MPYLVSEGNWTNAVKNNIDSDTGLYSIGYDTVNLNPAPGCDRQTFYASYKCGNETTTRTVDAILNAAADGKQAKFDCSNLINKCDGLKLYLEDNGILTLKDKDEKKIWDSTQSPMSASPIPNNSVALNEFIPANNPNVELRKNFLKSGEFLKVGEYISSPTGKCRLEMIQAAMPVDSVWSTISDGFVTTMNRTLIRCGSINSGKWSGILKIIPLTDTIISKQAILNEFVPTTTANYNTIKSNVFGTSITSNINIETSSAQGNSWITIGTDGSSTGNLKSITIKEISSFRYGSNGDYINKDFNTSSTTTVSIPDDIFNFVQVKKSDTDESIPDNITPDASSLHVYKYGNGTTWYYKKLKEPFLKTNLNALFVAPTSLNILTAKLYVSQESFPGIASGSAYDNILQIKMDNNAPSGNILQVVYNTLGCTEDDPINSESSSLYTIPWTFRENLNRMGYVNKDGQLQTYGTGLTIENETNIFTKLTNNDGTSYGMFGGNLGSVITENITSDEDCKQKCETNAEIDGGATCIGFEYETVGKTCQLKGTDLFSNGQGLRRQNINPNKNYEYYSRIKGVSGIDTSCPSEAEDIKSISVDKWTTFFNNKSADTLTSTTKCGLQSKVSAERLAVNGLTNELIDNSSVFRTTIDKLYTKYQNLKDSLLDTKNQLSTKFNELNESKNALADWSGEQAAQLDAINEDRELNLMSQNYKHIIWSILAILIIIIIIKIMKSFGGISIPDITKTADVAKASVATATATA